jgi:WD40 repeat protein
MSQDSSNSDFHQTLSLNWTMENIYFQNKPLALSGDGKTLAVWNNEKIEVWRLQKSLFFERETEQQELLRELKNLGQDKQLAVQLPQNSCSSMALNKEGQILASGTREGKVYLWEMSQISPPQPSYFSSKPSNLVLSVAFSHDNSTLASGSLTQIKWWDVQKHQKIDDIFRGFGWINALAFSPNGTLLASSALPRYPSSVEAQIYLWDLQQRQRQDALTIKPRTKITVLTFNPVKQNEIFCGTADGKIVLVSLDDKEVKLTFQAHGQSVNLLAFSPHGETLISSSSDGTLKSWQIQILSSENSNKLEVEDNEYSRQHNSPYWEKLSAKINHHSTSEEIEKAARSAVDNRSNLVESSCKLMVLTDEESKNNLHLLLKAQFPLIFLRSSEEERAINYLIHAHRSIISELKLKGGELIRWSNLHGFRKASLSFSNLPQAEFVDWQTIESVSETRFCQEALKYLSGQLETASKETDQQFTCILPDWPAFLKEGEANNQALIRQLRELAIAIEARQSHPRMTLIIVASSWFIPAMLRDYVHLVDLLPPTVEELAPVFQEILQGCHSDFIEKLSKNAKGMPLKVAKTAAHLIQVKKINTLKQLPEAKEILLQLRQQEVKKTGVLEYCIPQGNGLQDVGGLDNLKSWIKERKRWFEQNDNPKLRPRAILLEGYPGTGKSFIANAIAKQWNVPQINFEISRLKSKFVGETENRTIEALQAIEASAPCMIFIDEIEKAFAGVETDSSGVSTHQFGTFLSWLNDHESPVFVIVTSNDSEKLPPELFRPGRFDKRFIFLLPTSSERIQIIKNRINAYNLTIPQDCDINQLINELDLEGFSGAELDQLVKEAIYQRSSDISSRPPTPEESQRFPNSDEWKKARERIHPQINSPSKQELLKRYLNRIKADGESASELDEKALEKLEKLVPKTNSDSK